MACDTFSFNRARTLLEGKIVYIFGDSNMRALYKDLTWLLEDGRLLPQVSLKIKNEVSHANDVRISDGCLHSGRDYEEIRAYKGKTSITFQFITRLYQRAFIDTISELPHTPDVIAINSCVWDLTRWGSSGVEQFKRNVLKTFTFLKSELPSTRIIWLNTMPPSFKSQGGFLTQEIEFMRNMLPWHVVYANKYASDLAISMDIDVLDLHYHFRFLINHHAKDGIHWNPKAVRYATNLLLTHVALVWNKKLPGEFELDNFFVQHTSIIPNDGGKEAGSFNKVRNKKQKMNKARRTHNRRGFGTVWRNHHSFDYVRGTLMDAQHDLNYVPRFDPAQCTFYRHNSQGNRNVEYTGQINQANYLQYNWNLMNVVKMIPNNGQFRN